MLLALVIAFAVVGGWLSVGALLAVIVGRGIRIADNAAPRPERPLLRLVPDPRWPAVETDTPSATGSTPPGGNP